MNLKYAILEDETNARSVLRNMIAQTQTEMQFVGEASGVEEGLVMANNLKFDVLFLDIQLKDGSAFDFLDKLEGLSFKIIFTTAHDEYALRAFKYHAVDYLLKPIDPDELEQTLNLVDSQVQSEKQYKNLLQQVKNKEVGPNMITLRTSDNIYFFHPKDIIRVEGLGSYSKFVTANQTVLVSKNLRHYEEVLKGNNFFRVHQSHLINLDKVIQLDKNELSMENDELVPVATRKKNSLIKKLKT